MKKKIILLLFAICFFFQAFSAVDLVMSNGGIIPNGMTRGTSYSITVYVSNIGSTSTTTSFYVNISINTSATYNGNQTYLTDIFVNGGIAAGQTKTLTTTITIPCSSTAGTRYILDGADATNLIAESNETNNNFNFSFLNRNLNTPLPTSPTNNTQTSFQANWQTIPEATSYTLLVALNNTFTNILPGYNNLNVGNTISRVVSGLNCNTNYYYRVQSVNSCGSSPALTSEQIATTSACCNVPNPPNANAASNIAVSSFTAHWNTSSGATAYFVDVSTSSTFSSYVYNNQSVGNTTSYNFTGLNCNTLYYYRVRASSSCGTSNNSSTISVTTCLCCTSPNPPTANAASGINATSFIANWNTSSGATGYFVDVSTSPTFSSYVFNNQSVGNITTYNFTGLNCNTQYYYRVRAGSGCGTSNNSSMISVTTSACCTPPATPAGLTATPISSSQINLNWNSVANATGYDVFLCNGNYLGYMAAPNTSFPHTGLTANTSYSYKIQAQNGGASCVSQQTSCISATTLSNTCVPPSTPTSLIATPISSSQINLNWNSVTNASGYDVFLCNGNYLGYVAAPSTSYPHTSLTANTSYSYKIQAQKGAATCVSPQTNCVNGTTLNTTVNPVPQSIMSPLPSLPNTFIYQSSLPIDLYNASTSPIICRPKFNCSEVFLFQSPQNPNVTTPNELIPKAIQCFNNLQNSWEFRQRGFITNNGGSNPCKLISQCATTTQNGNPAITHSQNACWDKDDRYAWDINLQGGANSNGTCVYAIEDGIVEANTSHRIKIKHTNSNGDWYSWYDNIDPNINLGPVLKKQHIGHIRKLLTNSGANFSHLHFSILFKDANGKLISVNRQITPNTTNIAGSPYTITNINGTCTGSIISSATIYFKKEGEWYNGGITDENGKFQFEIIPGLQNGDSIKVVASGYETFSLRVNSTREANLDFKFPMIKSNSNNKVTNPSFYALNNSIFFTTPSVSIKINGNNYSTYSVYKITNSEEQIDYVPLSLNHSFLDSIINIPITDTGENNIGIFYYGIDTVLISKIFYYNPNLTTSYNVTINADASASQALMYVNNSFIKLMNQQSESFKLLPIESKITFYKLGYLDTTFIIVANTSINLKMTPIKPEFYSSTDSIIIDFIENGKVQHWEKVTLMDSLAKSRIVIKQYEKTYLETRLQPLSRTIAFSNTIPAILSNIKLVAVLDQVLNFSKQNAYLMKILDDSKFTKIPFTSNVADYDSAFQKLTYNYINFQNGISTREAIVVMKKQPPIITEIPFVVIMMNDTLKLPLSLFVTDPDNLKKDITVTINNVSVPISKFQFSILDSFVYIKTGNNFIGNVIVNISATHDFLTVTKELQLKVLPPSTKDILNIYPNPASSAAIADLLLTGEGKYTLVMYDIQGRVVKTFFSNKTFTRGHYIESLNLSNIPTGTYFFKLNDKPRIKFIKVKE
jgi:hypothetical protein